MKNSLLRCWSGVGEKTVARSEHNLITDPCQTETFAYASAYTVKTVVGHTKELQNYP